MNIGIIIYTQTGNTGIVARKLQEKLSDAGHTANVEQITISGDTPAQPGKFKLDNVPAVDGYDAIIFGSPVQAFSLNPVMKSYLEQLPSMTNNKVACFVTKQLPISWTGGTQATGKMRSICGAKGAVVKGGEIIFWSKGKRDQSVSKGVENLSNLF